MATPKDQVKAARDAAQQVLHALWTAGQHDLARTIYGGMRAYVQSKGGGGKFLADAKRAIATLPAAQQGPLNAFLAIPGKDLYDAKSDGFPAPPQADPGSVGSLPDSAGKTLGGALTDINGFLSRLTQRNTWIRVGEILLGVVLIAVGVARMTNAVSAATKIAKAVA